MSVSDHSHVRPRGQTSGKTGDGTGRAAVSLLDPGSRTPLYHQIFIILRDRIYRGHLGPSALVPGEQELAGEFGVSRITAKRALNEMADAGLVIRERGRGTRVVARPPIPAVRSSIEGWLENISLMGVATEARVRDFGYVPASEEVARALGVAPGEEVQRAERVRYLDGQPMSFLVTYVPADIGRQYQGEDLNRRPLLNLLEKAGVSVASARQVITATVADTIVAKALEIHAGAPLLEVLRVVQDRSGRAVEYIRVLYRPDLYRFEMTMQRVREEGGMRWSADQTLHEWPEREPPAAAPSKGKQTTT